MPVDELSCIACGCELIRSDGEGYFLLPLPRNCPGCGLEEPLRFVALDFDQVRAWEPGPIVPILDPVDRHAFDN